jgi:hypothetical protein
LSTCRWQSDGPRFDSEAIATSDDARTTEGRLMFPSSSRAAGLSKAAELDESVILFCFFKLVRYLSV